MTTTDKPCPTCDGHSAYPKVRRVESDKRGLCRTCGGSGRVPAPAVTDEMVLDAVSAYMAHAGPLSPGIYDDPMRAAIAAALAAAPAKWGNAMLPVRILNNGDVHFRDEEGEEVYGGKLRDFYDLPDTFRSRPKLLGPEVTP